MSTTRPKGALPFRLPTLTCKRCGHEWHPKSNRRPVRCARCKSPYWDRERLERADTDQEQVDAAANEGMVGQDVGAEEIENG